MFLRRMTAFQWFLIAFSDLPSRHWAMKDHLFPYIMWAPTKISSSWSVQGSFLMLGLS